MSHGNYLQTSYGLDAHKTSTTAKTVLCAITKDGKVSIVIYSMLNLNSSSPLEVLPELLPELLFGLEFQQPLEFYPWLLQTLAS